MSGKRSPSPKRGGHVTAVDVADAKVLINTINNAGASHSTDGFASAVKTIARLLAGKREEWIACALIRAERMYQLKARKDVT